MSAQWKRRANERGLLLDRVKSRLGVNTWGEILGEVERLQKMLALADNGRAKP